MKTLKDKAILCFIVSIVSYAAAATYFFTTDSKSSAVIYLCLGSALLCLGAAQLNNYKKEQKKDGKDDK